MKKIFGCIMAILLTAGMLTACARADNAQVQTKKLSVVCTIFPEYDWVRQILGSHLSNADVTLLLDNGVDLHNYQPTADDIVKISGCDVFIYVGGESDGWVADALKEATNKNMVVINLLEALGGSIKEEQIVEGMQAEEEEEAETAEEGPEYDEHVWLSLKNAKMLVSSIAESIGKADQNNAADYTKNAAAYNEKLDALDKEYAQTVKSAGTKTILFGDRFPFRYLVDDYELNYYAAFVGCSAETEASFETVVFLSQKMDELKLKHILVIDSSDQSIAKAIISNTAGKDQQILTLNSMQSVTAADITAGAAYLSIMQSNLEVLKTALN